MSQSMRLRGQWWSVLRSLRRNSAFAATVIATVTIMVGGTTAVFGLVQAMIFGPLPGKAPEKLRFIYSTNEATDRSISYAVFEDLISRDSGLVDILAAAPDATWITTSDEPELLSGEAVSSSYFNVLGVSAIVGATFESASVEPGEPLMVISEHLWRRAFNGMRDVVGSRVLVTPSGTDTSRSRSYRIAGVVPDAFRGVLDVWGRSDYWVLLSERAKDRSCTESPVPAESFNRDVRLIARLKSSVSDEQAASWLAANTDQIRTSRYPRSPDWSLFLSASWRSRLPFGSLGAYPRPIALALFGMSGIVDIIGVAGLAGLLATRAVRRRTDMAVRAALGATPWELRRLCLLENGLLCAVGCLLGVALARGLLNWFIVTLPSVAGAGPREFAIDIPIGAGDWIFAAATAAAIALIITLVPLRAIGLGRPSTALGGHVTATGDKGVTRLQHAVVVVQMALSCALVTLAALTVRGLLEQQVRHLDYAAGDVVYAGFTLSTGRCAGTTRPEWVRASVALSHRVLEVAEEQADIVPAVAFALPFKNSTVEIIAAESSHLQHRATVASVSPRYFETLRVRIVAGRPFVPVDIGPGSARIAIVSSRLASTLWPGGSALGQRLALRLPGDSDLGLHWHEVVGVAEDIDPGGTDGAPIETVYFPVGQFDVGRVLLARSSAVLNLEKDLSRIVRTANSHAYVAARGRLDAAVAALRYPQRVAVSVALFASVVGLILVGLGLVATVSFAVARQARALAIRSALGASRVRILGGVIRQAVIWSTLGSICGVGVSAVAVRWLTSAGLGLGALNVLVVGVVLSFVTAFVLAACYLPARRALSVSSSVLRDN